MTHGKTFVQLSGARGGRPRGCKDGCRYQTLVDELCEQCVRRRYYACVRKRHHPHLQSAMEQIEEMEQLGKAVPWELMPYPCPWGCGCYHVGHRGKRSYARMVRDTIKHVRREKYRELIKSMEVA